MPATRGEFWKAKFARTVERDAEAIAALEEMGWQAVVLWECQLKDPEQLRRLLGELVAKEGS